MDERLREMIEGELKRTGGNASKVSRTYDVNHQLVRNIARSSNQSRDPLPAIGNEPEDIKSLGRPNLRDFVVAVKKDGNPEWPSKYQEVIEVARQKYDDGTHEMCQGLNSKGWVVLYCIPRVRKRTKGLNYFASMTVLA